MFICTRLPQPVSRMEGNVEDETVVLLFGKTEEAQPDRDEQTVQHIASHARADRLTGGTRRDERGSDTQFPSGSSYCLACPFFLRVAFACRSSLLLLWRQNNELFPFAGQPAPSHIAAAAVIAAVFLSITSAELLASAEKTYRGEMWVTRHIISHRLAAR